jgi:hypothetical protein
MNSTWPCLFTAVFLIILSCFLLIVFIFSGLI